MRRLTILRSHRQRFSRTGSAIILTLVLASILAFSIAALLLNVRDASRATSDKVAYEEAYHAALGGVQMTKAWLIHPALARTHLGSTAGSGGQMMSLITSGSVVLTSDTVVKKAEGHPEWAIQQNPTTIAGVYAQQSSALGSGPLIEGGSRKVLYELTGDPLRLQNDTGDTTPSGYLRTATGNVLSRITKIRITTPYCAVAGSETGVTPAGRWTRDTLLRTSLIVDCEAKTITQGVEKTRWLQQKLLVAPTMSQTSSTIPGINDSPPLSPGGAIVSGGAVVIQGESHMNVWWGPVQVRGSIQVLQFDPMTIDPVAKTISLNASGNKFYGAGIDNTQDSPIGLEKWLRWQCGPNYAPGVSDPGVITSQGDDIFPSSVDLGQGAGNYIDDLLTRFKNYQASGANYAGGGLNLPETGYSMNLTGTYNVPWSGGSGIYFTPLQQNQTLYPVGTGAFVQRSQAVSDMVTRTIAQDLNYAAWKRYAIQKNGYAKPTRNGFVNEQNVPLWVTSDRRLVSGTTRPSGTTRFTELKQISMKPYVPASGVTYNLADQILFIDTMQGNPVGGVDSSFPGASTTPGEAYDVTLNSADAFFWKGLMYVNGGVSTSGAGGFTSIWMQNPDQFSAHPGIKGGPDANGALWGHMIDGCYLDGILFAAGSLSRTGNSSIYGSVVSSSGTMSGGGPDIYYNSRIHNGLFQQPPQTVNGWNIDPDNRRVISGPIRELSAWPS